jgi:peptidoglycan/xylan/chitin deacetylase (PgdA/CDA1 family)
MPWLRSALIITMLITFRFFAAVFILLFCSLFCSAQQHTVALTFDDLPAIGTTDVVEANAINLAILHSLDRHNAPATGFVIEERVHEIGDIPGKKILRQWVQHHHDLGNHSFSHPDFDKLTVEQIEQEIVLGEKSLSEILREVGKTPRYFRFPMNHTGDTPSKHAAAASFLAQRGHKLAVCTIDNEDYAFSEAYLLMLSKKDKVSAKRLREDYLAYTSAEIDYYSTLNKEVLGYEPPHVMLLHVNRLNADMVDAVMSLFEQKHYTFVTLDKAYADPAFAIPDTFVTPYGPMWGYRWAAERGVKVNGKLELEPPAWILDYGKK